jgi:hypothetical protein
MKRTISTGLAGAPDRTVTKGKRVKRLLTGGLSVALLSVLLVVASATPASADPPTVEVLEATFDDVNPCTGLEHTVTISSTFFQHDHRGERFVEHGKSILTTSPTGFVGRGSETLVDNGQQLIFRFADMLSNPAGDRIRVRVVLVIDLTTDTFRVENSDFTCLGK